MKILRISTAAALLTALALSLFSCKFVFDTPGSKPEDGSDAPEGKVKATFTILGETAGESDWLDPGTVLEPVGVGKIEDSANEYEFLGWDADGDGIAEEFPYKLNESVVFAALLKADPKIFHYDIYVRGELKVSADCKYGDDINYPEVSSFIEDGEAFIFMGWKYDGAFDGMIRTKVTKSTVIEAYFADSQVLKLYYEGGLYAKRVPQGDPIPTLAAWGVQPRDGYEIVWYADPDFTARSELAVMPQGNLTLYGRQEKQGGSGTISVKSDEQLIKAFDSLLLKHETEADISLDYDHMPLQQLPAYLSANSISLFGYRLSASSSDGRTVKFAIEYSPLAVYRSENVLYTQLPSANLTLERSDRGSGYNSFAVETVEDCVQVTNSEALYYALENGVRPVPVGKDAEQLYAAMKDVLREYVSDSMTDVQKAAAIYEYLIMNTVYDGELLEKVIKGENAEGYRSFCLEGVFVDRLAVCDGLSKAFSCLCRIEGIECVRVTGKKSGSGVPHAWNKVKLGGKWYIVDVTSGGTLTGNEEVLSYVYFMMTDKAYEKVCRAGSDPAADIKCDTEYDIYEQRGLKADTPEKAASLLKNYIENAPEGRSSFEFELGYKISSDSKAVSEILKLIKSSVNVSYLSSGCVFCFIYDK